MKNYKHTINLQYYHSPCRELVLASVGEELCLCDWKDNPCAERNMRRLMSSLNAELKIETSLVSNETRRQLEEYFAGNRKAFSIPLHPVGTDFQLQVWKALLNIPYGATRSYKQIATRPSRSRESRGKSNRGQRHQHPHPLPSHNRQQPLANGICRRAGGKETAVAD